MTVKTIPDNYWKNNENIRNFMLELKSKLDFTSDEDWYSLNIDIIQKNGGRSVLSTFKDSPQALIKAAFPELTLYPWRFKTKVPKNFWVSLENQRYFIDVESKRLGFTTKDDYYKFTGKIIADAGAYGLIKKYKESVYLMLKTLYPEKTWYPWKFIQVPTSFSWKKAENLRSYCDWLYMELGYKSIEDWYNLTQDEIRNHCGAGLVFHTSSPERILKLAYPDIKFDQAKFNRWKAEGKLFKVFSSIVEDGVQRFVIDDCKGERDYPFDMGSISKKIIIECDGDQHFKLCRRFKTRKPEDIMNRDVWKMKKAVDQGYTVIRFHQSFLLKLTEKEIKDHIFECLDDNSSCCFFISDKSDIYNNHIKLFKKT